MTQHGKINGIDRLHNIHVRLQTYTLLYACSDYTMCTVWPQPWMNVLNWGTRQTFLPVGSPAKIHTNISTCNFSSNRDQCRWSNGFIYDTCNHVVSFTELLHDHSGVQISPCVCVILAVTPMQTSMSCQTNFTRPSAKAPTVTLNYRTEATVRHYSYPINGIFL